MVRIGRGVKHNTLCNRSLRGSLCRVGLIVVCLGGWGSAASGLRADTLAGSLNEPQVTADPNLVKDLLKKIDDPLPKVRRETISRLAQLGPAALDAVPALTNRLQDPDLYVRAHAARAICRTGADNSQALSTLADLIVQDDQQACCLAALIAGDLGASAFQVLPALHSCLKSRNLSVRIHAAEAILKIDWADAASLRELLAGFDSDNATTRYVAANALGSAAPNNENARFALEWALTDSDTNVAIAAALNLSKLFDLPDPPQQDPTSGEELAGLLAELKNPAPAVRQKAAIRLGMSGPAARHAVGALREKLSDPDLAVRAHVAHALWQIEKYADEILPALIDMLGVTTPNVSTAAVHILGEIGPAAADALPSLYDMFAGSRVRNRLMLAATICRIDPRDREMIGILVAALHEPEGDVRYLSAVALGNAALAHQHRIERSLTTASEDRNLRVQAAATEGLMRFRARIDEARVAATARHAVAVDSSEGTLVVTPISMDSKSGVQGRIDAKAVARTSLPESPVRVLPPPPVGNLLDDAILSDDDGPRDRSPAVADAAPFLNAEGKSAVIEDSDEGLKSIRTIRATIRTTTGPLPDDYAAAKLAGMPTVHHGWGTTRGFMEMAYCWDAPAMYFKPIYFEDVNLERYGQHFDGFQPFVSFWKFFATIPVLPYKMLVQPPCTCVYTLGYERANNCMPLHCYKLGWPNCSLPWCNNYCKCTIGPTCPFESDEDVCGDPGLR